MFCSKCGKEMSDDTIKCQSCGAEHSTVQTLEKIEQTEERLTGSVKEKAENIAVDIKGNDDVKFNISGKEIKDTKKLFKPQASFIVILFLVLAAVILILAIIYYIAIQSNNDMEIKAIQEGFGDYQIPTLVAKKYVSYSKIRDFNFIIYYGLSLLSIVTSIIVISYAAFTDDDDNDVKKTNKNKRKSPLIFFSMLSMLCTILLLLINPLSVANAAQDAWLSLQETIISVCDKNIDSAAKDTIITNKLIEIESLFSAIIYK